MKLLSALRTGCAVGALLGLVAGCTTSSADGPTSPSASATASASVVDPSTDPPTPTAPTPSVIDTPKPVSSSLDPKEQEAANRAAIDSQWIKFWDVYQEIVRTPPATRSEMAARVAVPTLAEKLVSAAETATSEHKDNYGDIVHHTFWQFDVGGQETAVIADCQDQSHAGTIEVDTGAILTTGREKTNLRGRMQQGDDGIWRVAEVIALNETPC